MKAALCLLLLVIVSPQHHPSQDRWVTESYARTVARTNAVQSLEFASSALSEQSRLQGSAALEADQQSLLVTFVHRDFYFSKTKLEMAIPQLA